MAHKLKHPYRKRQLCSGVSERNIQQTKINAKTWTSLPLVNKILFKKKTKKKNPRTIVCNYTSVSFLAACEFLSSTTCGRENKHNTTKSNNIFTAVVTAGTVFALSLLTGSVSLRVLECSPFVRASRRLSASLYTYSSDLARNSGKLSITQIIKTPTISTDRGNLHCATTKFHQDNLPAPCWELPSSRTNAPGVQWNIWRADQPGMSCDVTKTGTVDAHTCLSPADWTCLQTQNRWGQTPPYWCFQSWSRRWVRRTCKAHSWCRIL